MRQTRLRRFLPQLGPQFSRVWTKQIVFICTGIKVMYEREKKPLRHHLPLMIFDRSHRIPKATHLLQLCSQDVMSRGSISFNYSHLSSIYTSAARSFLRTEILCSSEFTGKTCFFFCLFLFFPLLLYKVLSVPTANPGHYISFSALLYQTMTSACSNCFQTRHQA